MLGSIFLFSASALAEERLIINPYLEIEEKYNDNYYRSEKNETKVFVSRFSPASPLAWSMMKTGWTLITRPACSSIRTRAATKTRFKYWKQDYVGHNLNFYTVGDMGEHFDIGVEDQFIFTRDAASSDRFSLAVDRDKYGVNRVSPFLSYDIAEYGTIKLAYRHENLEYLTGSEDNNSFEQRAIGTLTYHFNEQNHLDCENQYWKRYYQGGTYSEYTSYQLMGLFRHEFNEFFSMHIGGGYHWRDYKESSVKKWGGLAVRAGLTGETDITTVYLNFEHNINDYGQGNSYYVSSQATAFVERVFFEAVPVRLGRFLSILGFSSVQTQGRGLGDIRRARLQVPARSHRNHGRGQPHGPQLELVGPGLRGKSGIPQPQHRLRKAGGINLGMAKSSSSTARMRLLIATIVLTLCGIAWPAASNTYTIGVNDILSVSIFAGGKTQESLEIAVSTGGTIRFPFLGEIRAAGLTVPQLVTLVSRPLAEDYFVNPQVIIRVKEFKSQKVYITGAVATPGLYPLEQSVTLLELIARAGGVTKERGNYAFILKGSVSEVEQPEEIDVLIEKKGAAKVDLRKLLEQGRVEENMIIAAGDVVYIQPSSFSDSAPIQGLRPGQGDQARRFRVPGRLDRPGRLHPGRRI